MVNPYKLKWMPFEIKTKLEKSNDYRKNTCKFLDIIKKKIRPFKLRLSIQTQITIHVQL